ncbi:MAG: phosphohistidine phosphatase SixA [Desulfobacterales bacterium]|nr:phosphohistidine phosphatase SixA [Desulfobacterales bacterium]
MSLFLAQHGLALPKDQDPEKGLSPQGRADTLRIAEVAAVYNVPVARIVHSGKVRAAQTAAIFEDHLKPPRPTGTIPGISPLDDAPAFGNRVDPRANLLVVGHLPFMERLVSHLTCGDPDKRVYKFQNSGLVCLEEDQGDWYIKWTLNPRVD